MSSRVVVRFCQMWPMTLETRAARNNAGPSALVGSEETQWCRKTSCLS